MCSFVALEQCNKEMGSPRDVRSCRHSSSEPYQFVAMPVWLGALFGREGDSGGQDCPTNLCRWDALWSGPPGGGRCCFITEEDNPQPGDATWVTGGQGGHNHKPQTCGQLLRPRPHPHSSVVRLLVFSKSSSVTVTVVQTPWCTLTGVTEELGDKPLDARLGHGVVCKGQRLLPCLVLTLTC